MMGRRKHLYQCGSNKDSNSDSNKSDNLLNKYFTSKHKKSKKKRVALSESEKEYDSDYIERKKHKHKRKKRKHDSRRYGDEPYSESESYHQHRHKHSNEYREEDRQRHHRSKEKKSSKNNSEQEIENPSSRWDDDDNVRNQRIKTEPISDDELQSPDKVDANLITSESKTVHKNEGEKWGKHEGDRKPKEEENQKKDKVNFKLSGKLTEDTNMYNGVVIKYSQPPEARKPKRRWRWYIFKGEEELPFLPLHRQSAYLIGRDRKVADIPTDHPSCSKQHAVLQYRLVTYDRPDGTKGRTVKPFVLDLESANGTYVNNRRIDPRRYVELLEKDVVKFGYSSREYVLLHEASKGSEEDVPDAGADISPISLLRTL